MEILLLIIGLVAVTLLRGTPARRPQIVYVPMEVPDERGRLSCLPWIAIGILVLLILFIAGGISG